MKTLGELAALDGGELGPAVQAKPRVVTGRHRAIADRFGRVVLALASLLVMSVFVDFNSVLYTHYPCWVVPLLVLTACDAMAPPAAADPR